MEGLVCQAVGQAAEDTIMKTSYDEESLGEKSPQNCDRAPAKRYVGVGEVAVTPCVALAGRLRGRD